LPWRRPPATCGPTGFDTEIRAVPDMPPRGGGSLLRGLNDEDTRTRSLRRALDMRQGVFAKAALVTLLLCLPSGVAQIPTCSSSLYSCWDCGGHPGCWYGGSAGFYYLGESIQYAHCIVTWAYCGSSGADCYVAYAEVQGVCPDGSTWWTYGDMCCYNPPW
jgi:hypothetical protein